MAKKLKNSAQKALNARQKHRKARKFERKQRNLREDENEATMLQFIEATLLPEADVAQRVACGASAIYRLLLPASVFRASRADSLAYLVVLGSFQV